jgi:hypothetical protein
LKLPYSNIKNEQRLASLKIYQEILEGNPPATRPDNLNYAMRKLWDHLELCWNIDPEKRPSVTDAVKFLEDNGRHITQRLSGDFDIPVLSHLRKEPVVDLTGRVENISVRPLAEGGYSNVWRGTLDNNQLVRSYCLVRSPLIMSVGLD